MFKVIFAANERTLQAALDHYMTDGLPADTVATISSTTAMPNGNLVVILSLTPEA